MREVYSLPGKIPSKTKKMDRKKKIESKRMMMDLLFR